MAPSPSQGPAPSTAPAGRHLVAVTLAVAALTLLGRLSGLPLLDPDEGRNASVAREMLERGAWIVPTLNGLPYNGTDTYEQAADARGELHLPYVRFTDALRVRTLVTSRPAVGGGMTTRRQVGFWSECFGEVGRATSKANEAAADFTTAESQRRLAI